MTVEDWEQDAGDLQALYAIVARLEARHPGRKFTPDGHLVGSIGEVIGAAMFGLTLNPASTKGHDAVTKDGREVEIKMTQGTSVAIRHEPEHLIVLHRPPRGTTQVVYNGPGARVWSAAGKMASNGQRPISLARLRALDKEVADADRLPVVRPAPV